MLRTLITLLSLCASSAVWSQDAIQSPDGRYGIVAGPNGPRVQNQRGASVPLNIPSDVHLRYLVSLRGGWLAAGSQPVGNRRELFLRLLDPGGLKRIPSPGFQQGLIRQQPVVLSDGERLVGILWLEGDAAGRLAVRSSEWLGITWSRPVTVAAPGPGSQMALAATILDDGSWLAAWSRFDGEDDEIFYSLAVGNVWTTPSALTANAVPDILPTIAPSEHGALIAWNQYDGEEYRVVTSRLQEGRWLPGTSEPRGSLYPRFIMDGDQPTLLFYQASGVWRLQDMDREGRIKRQGSVPAESNERPLLLRTQVDGETPPRIELQWSRGGSKSAPAWERPQ